MPFDDETTDVLPGGYLSKDAAMEDYEAVLKSGGYLDGAVVVSKDLEGKLSVKQTAHMVRGTRRCWIRGRSVRAAPAGDDRGRRGDRSRCRCRQAAASQDRRQTRGAGGRDDPSRRRWPDRRIPHSAAAQVEPTVTRAINKVVGEAEGHHVRALKGAIADAQKKMAEGGT